MPLLSVIIPVYNEEKTINELLNKVFSVSIDKEVIVVDDGSSDTTPRILSEISHPDGSGSSPFKFYLKVNNEGKGAAVRYGIKKATGKYIIIQDADLEYEPDDYKSLLEPLIRGEAEVVYGNRFPLGSKNMFFKQRIANKCLTAITNLLFRGNIGDMETCYKVVPTALLKSLDIKEENFDIEAEISAKLLRKKIKIKNVPVRYKGRSYHEGKKIGLKDMLSAVKVLVKYRVF